MSKKHILVTGGSGFVGSHLCDLLLEKGYSVTAVDNLLTGRKENIRDILDHPDFSFVEHDISLPLDDASVPLIKRDGLAGVLHFACPASPVDFEKLPFEILRVDSLGTMVTVDLAIRHSARYLLASTSEIYGDPLVHPQNESYFGNVNTIGPRACYDETKRFAEAYVSTAMRGVGTLSGRSYRPLNAAGVRIFNTYGPRMRSDDGRVVPQLCMQALRGEPLTIHGTGKQTRSFCFVSDLVDGIVRLFESSLNRFVNIGNPVEKTILEFADVVRVQAGVKSDIRHLPGREDDPRQRCPDITLAQKELGWSPKLDLEEGIRKSLDYFRKCELQ